MHLLFGTATQAQVDVIHTGIKQSFRSVMFLTGSVVSLHEKLSNMSENMESQMQTIWRRWMSIMHKLRAYTLVW